MVAGRYKLLSRIAEGGMGVVYKAEHVLSRKKLAIKILHPHLCHGRQAVERFRREVSAAAEIDHPGIVQVFDAGVDNDGSFYMAMELLDGESLGARTRREWPGTRTAVELIIGMCAPLARAHEKGFVHRDLKPDNIFIARDHTGVETVKLLDFGLVREVTRRGPTQSGITFGTPEYMAPEQAMSAKKADVGADVWSVGVMLYELLAGRHPFTGETANAVMANAIKEPHPRLAEVAPHVPEELAKIVERCLEKDPARRPRHAGELGAALRTLTTRTTLDEQRPQNPVLRSHIESEEDALEGDEAAGNGGLDLDEHALLSSPPQQAGALDALAARAGLEPTDPAGRPAKTRSKAARSGAWVAVGAGALGLLGVIGWALSQRDDAGIVATQLPEARPAVAPAATGEATVTIPAPQEPAAPPAAETAPRPPEAPAAPVEAAVEAPEAAPAVVEAAPEPVRSTTRHRRASSGPTEGSESALAEAQACLQRGDTRCAVQLLQGGQSAAEMSLLVDVYRMQGRTGDARSVMQRYLRRFSRGSNADAYRRELALGGE
ncbi:Hypothetical protein I5071_71530 [Sandaracinus amylolyticus]|nr:Hypothetical protein I5071_71530 [Sandaracinus amylolyticus]